MPSGGGFGFGPFRLDVRGKHLFRHGEPVALAPRQFELILEFVSHAGEIVTKARLMKVGWPDVIVTDNNLVKAITQLRRLLDERHPDQFITTASRVGYRFIAPVTREDDGASDVDVDALLAPHRGMIDGRAALETLELSEISRARTLFERLLGEHPRDARLHVGLATACILQYESTRTDLEPNAEALRLAVFHAREACRLNPQYGEAWATLGFVLERAGERMDALAALRRAVTLEPDNWLHHVRHAAGSWGEERLRAARRALTFCPGLPMALWLSASVYVARQSFGHAEDDVDAGRRAMAGEAAGPSRLSAVALHLLKGLLCAARGADDEALAALDQELALEGRGHLYSRECCANAWYVKGAVHLRRRDLAAARAAFEQALARVPRHPMAGVGLALAGGSPPDGFDMPASGSAVPVPFELVLARAALLVADEDVGGAAAIVTQALTDAPPGNAGWLLPIEPLIDVQQNPDVWVHALAVLQMRAR